MTENKEDMEVLTKKVEELTKENEELKMRLKKYSNPDRNKKFYEKHKDELKKKPYYGTSTYKPSKEQKKLYNKRAYEKRKKLKAENQ